MIRELRIWVLINLLLLTLILPPITKGQQFELRSPELNLATTYSQFPYFAGGLSVRDFDNDGWDDITIGTDSTQMLKFYKNYYGTFKAVELFPNQSHQDSYSIWVDYDNNGTLDFFGINRFTGAVYLMKVDSMFNFMNVTSSSGLGGLSGPKREGALFSDFNNDGLLDLYLAAYDTFQNNLFLQDTNHVFQNISTSSGTCDSVKATFHAIAMDYNEDGWMDFYLANDFSSGNEFYRNNGDSTFTEVGAITGTNVALDAMGLGVGDFDGDLDLDIHITDRFIQSRLLRNNGNLTFTEVGTNQGVNYPHGFGWGNNFFDADLDGDQDLYVSGIQTIYNTPSVLFINDGQGQFTGDTLPGDTVDSFSNAIGDFDNDRRSDILAQNSDGNPMSLWQNTTMVTAGRFTVKLRGCSSNHDGFDARIVAYDDTSSRLYNFPSTQSFQSQNSDRKIIPILNGPLLDSLKVFWPSGITNTLYDIAQDQSIELSECGNPRPYPIILVPDYAQHELVLCPGDSILLCIDGDYPSITWSTNETSDSIYVSSAGNYDVTVTNQFGETASSTKIAHVLESSYPEYSVDLIQSGCFNDGSITISPIPSWNIHDYSWSNGSLSNHVDQLQAGFYTVTISNNGFCPVIDTFEIISPSSLDPITIGLDILNPLCFGDEGEVSVTSSGGVLPHSYLWSNGLSTPTVSLTEGSYNLTIIDSLECMKDTTILIDAPPLLEVAPTIWPDTNGQGLGKAWVYSIGGTKPYSYQWSDSLMQSDDTAFHLVTGDYNVTVTDFNTCDTVLDIYVPDQNEMRVPTSARREKLGCKIIADRIIINAPYNQPSFEVYDFKGARISVDHTIMEPKVYKISLSDRGLYIIKDRESGATCKVIKL